MRITAAPERTFWRRLCAIAFGALVLRIGAAVYVHQRMGLTGDAVWYLGVARLLARGAGFVEPLHYDLLHVRMDSAAHPPLYPLFLSITDFLGMHTTLTHRIWSCVPGTITVVLVGLIGRKLAGCRAGLMAAGAAAISFALVIQDVMLWSEGFYGMTIAWSVLAAYRYLCVPRSINAVVLTVAITVSALTRAEAALLFGVLLLPLVLRLGTTARERVRVLGACALTAGVLLAPWTIYNAGRFEHPVVLSTGLGGLIGSSNCDITYHGPLTGGWGYFCAKGLPKTLPRDETAIDLLFRRAGWKYVREHSDRLPVVVPLRLLRTFGFWRPASVTSSDLQLRAIGRGELAWLAVAQYWVLLALGLGGGVVLVRRRVPWLPLAAPLINVVVITILGYGTMRFRLPLDVVLPVGVGVLLGGRRVTSRVETNALTSR